MIGFYLTTNGSYNPELIEDVSNSFIMDDKNKKLTVMGAYEFEFQKLSGTYETASTDASSLALSIYGANKLYTTVNGRLPLDASIEQWNAAKPGTVTSITAGTGLTGGSITDSGTIALDESGATAGTYGLSADASVNLNDSPLEVAIPNITVDAYGRVTSITTNKLKVANTDTIPAAGNYSELNTGTSETSKTWDASTISKFVKEQSGSSYDKGTIAQLNAGTDESPQVWDASTISNYVRTSTELGIRYRDDFDASTGVVGEGPDTLTTLEEKKGDMFIVSSEGTYLNHELQVGDAIIFKKGSSAGVSPIAGNLSFVQGVVKVVDGNATLDWETPVVVGTVEGVQLHVSLPAMPTKEDLGLSNVENKSSETIRSEITASNVSTALGYIPADANDLDDYVADTSVETTLTDSDGKIPTSKAVKSFVEGKGYTTNTGTVTSVGVTVPTGLSVSNSPITEDGSIAIAMSDGYKIPLDASLDAFQDSASKAHTHTNSGILNGLTDSSISDWNGAVQDKHSHDNKSVLDSISSDDVDNWIDASSKKHTHTNSGILNGLTDSSISDWNSAVQDKHSHDNKSVLDSISSDDVDNWIDASSKKHTHANSGILNGLTDTSVSDWNDAAQDKHTHDNKSVLDSISSDDVDNWIDASSKKHTHTNSGILNGLTDSSIEQWNAAEPGTVTSIIAGTGLTGGTITETGTIALDESGVTEGRYGQAENASVNKNGSAVTINVVDISIDVYGRVTSISNKTLSVANDDTTYDSGTINDLNTGTEIIAKLWDASTISQFVNATMANGVRYKGDVNATTGEIVDSDKTLTTASEKKGDMYVITTAGTIAGHELQIGDAIIFKANVAADVAPVEANLSFVQGTVKVTNEGATLQWGQLTKVANVEGVDISVGLPSLTAADISTALEYIPGTVKSVAMTVPTGLSISGSPITESGTLAVSLDTGYSIPTDASLNEFETAYLWGNHSAAGYAQASVVADVSAYAVDLSTRANGRIDEVSAYTIDVSTRLSATNTALGTLTSRVADVSSYAIEVSTYAANVSTNTNTRIANVSTLLNTANASIGTLTTRVANVSTYATDTSTRLNATNTSVNTKFGTVDSSLVWLYNHYYELSSSVAAAWADLYSRHPDLSTN